MSEFKAKLKEPELSFDGVPIARLEITDGNYRQWYSAQDADKEYTVIIKEYRPFRSNNANAYFHVLCRKIAGKLGISEPEVKNLMIARYGQPELNEDGKPIYMVVNDEYDTAKLEHLHLKPTAQTKQLNNRMYRTYVVMRGVGIKEGDDTYTTKEMSTLISGTISEAREIGLTEAEIISPREKALLKEVYGI